METTRESETGPVMVANTDSGTVVVGCDGSWDSYRAVDLAAREAVGRGCRLTVLVMPRGDPPGSDEPLSGYPAAEERGLSRAQVTAHLAQERALASAPDVGVDIVVDAVDGPAVKALAQRAVMLVIGGRGRGGQRALSLSSPSDELVRHLPVPIMIPAVRSPVPSAVPHAPHVVVGVDGRGGEEELISIAAVEAAARGCCLVIVRAVRPDRVGGGMARPQVWDETWMAVHQADKAASVSTRVVVTVGDPLTALTDECGPDDLLVVGTRGQGRLAGLVPGSVARGVLDAGTCHVMVVPPTARTVERAAR